MAGMILHGREGAYFALEAEVPVEQRALGYEEHVDPVLARLTTARRWVTTFVKSPLYCVLHWSDGSDLRELDRKVAGGEAVDADFANALVTQAQPIKCRNCGVRTWVLAYMAGVPVFPDGQRRLDEHRFIDRCPACDTHWTVLAVEILTGL